MGRAPWQTNWDPVGLFEPQLGGRLRFWVYRLLSDFYLESYILAMGQSGPGRDDLNTLGLFTSVGLREADGMPKPALSLWSRSVPESKVREDLKNSSVKPPRAITSS